MKTMRKKWRQLLVLPLALLLAVAIVVPWQLTRAPEPAYAGNVDATNISLTGQSAGSHTFVQFDLGWENSWRDVVNWDAAWVFVKYRVGGGDWQHAALSTTSGDHTAPTGSTLTATTDGTGVFIYRDAVGTGTVSFTGAQLKWNYFGQGVADDALVTVKVFAMEMVYIPQGSFWIGDYDKSLTNCFYEYGTTSPYGPYQITSEGEIDVGTTAGNLYYDVDTTTADAGDRGTPILADFPKGYDAFYMMKYEASQRQYAEFLNTLTATQQTTRFIGSTGTDRQYIALVGGVYGANANGNANILNESDDGEWVAANFLAWMDGAAYADWAGLRPYTELEFEKAARGTAVVVDDEYAWGNANVAGDAYTMSSDQQAGEVIATNYATGSVGNANYDITEGTSINGPLRVGIFALDTSTRIEAGASYYGVMELSGNLWEKVVTVGNGTGRAFTGSHGDGSLSTNGNATNSDWPGYVTTEVTGATGAGFRGGAWSRTASELRLSDRTFAARADAARTNYAGVRLARTAP